MSKQCYTDVIFHHRSRAQIAVINKIVEHYIKLGLRLTSRQIYYQLVARHGLPNSERSYRNTARLINDGKVAGLIDWDALEDRTRAFVRRARWASGAEILDSAARGFHMDMWEGQDTRVFVVIEKEALVGVLESVCSQYDVPLLAARGYPSGSVLREFCKDDIIPAVMNGQSVVVVHLGDHDPSGIDMTRDLDERISLFGEEGEARDITVDRIALTMAQVKKHAPPPNPAKMTDARFKEYARLYGRSSWELDALDPSYLSDLVETRIKLEINPMRWKKRLKKIATIRKRIAKVAKGF